MAYAHRHADDQCRIGEDGASERWGGVEAFMVYWMLASKFAHDFHKMNKAFVKESDDEERGRST